MKRTPLKRKTKLRVAGHSTVAEQKREIQALVREVVIKRDGGCVLRKIRNCGGEIGQAVLQADHLITRANSATFADTRLIVCLCRPCHGGFKKWHEKEYNALVRMILSPERVKLWDKCERDSWKPQRTSSYDWKMAIIALKQELRRYELRDETFKVKND